MEFGTKYPQTVILLRYEDLSLDPYGTVDRLIDFLNFETNQEFIDSAVQSITGKTRSGEQLGISKNIHNDPETFVKNSALKAFEWKTKINKSLLKAVETICEKPMEKLGYSKWNPDNYQTLTKSAIEVWPFS